MPDGYVTNAKELRDNFLTWCSDQKEAYIFPKNKYMVLRITTDLFLKYLNEEILGNSNEVAYFVDNKQPQKSKALLVVF